MGRLANDDCCCMAHIRKEQLGNETVLISFRGTNIFHVFWGEKCQCFLENLVVKSI